MRFPWVIEVPAERQTCLYYIKWENSHWLEGEPKRALPGWSQRPGLGFSPFNVRPLREHPKGLSCLPGQREALLEHEAHLEGAELARGGNHRFLQIIQGATGKRAHTGSDACKLDGTDFEKYGSVSTALPRMLLLLLAAETILGADELLMRARYPRSGKLADVGKPFYFKIWKKCS